jgi:hypothetical protein
MMIELETQVARAQAGGYEWLEVEKPVLLHFTKGQMPGSGYLIYKNIRLCLEGTAEELAKRDGLDVHAIVFKEEASKMRVGSVVK